MRIEAKTVKNNLTQDAMQWNLPEDAKARIGKGRINEIQYSPDGRFLRVEVRMVPLFYGIETGGRKKHLPNKKVSPQFTH